MNDEELRRKVLALISSRMTPEVMAEAIIALVERSVKRKGGRWMHTDSAGQERVKSDVYANPNTPPSSSGSGSDLLLFRDPDPSQPILEIAERDEPLPQGFAEFWSLWPKGRRVGKADAIRLWQRLKPPISKVRATLAWQVKDPWWQAGNAPHPKTWLRAKRWNDEEPPPPGPVRSEKELRGAAAIERLLAAGEAHKGGVK